MVLIIKSWIKFYLTTIFFLKIKAYVYTAPYNAKNSKVLYYFQRFTISNFNLTSLSKKQIKSNKRLIYYSNLFFVSCTGDELYRHTIFFSNQMQILDSLSIFFIKLTAFWGVFYLLGFLLLSRFYKLQVLDCLFLILMSIISTMVLCTTFNLMLTIILIECVSFSSYTLCAAYKNNYSVEAAWKYFSIGSLGSIFLLFGSSLIYIITASLNYIDISLVLKTVLLTDVLEKSLTIFLGIIFLFIGFFIKLGVAPFHQWVADVYDSVPYYIVFYISILPKIGIFIHLTRSVYYLFTQFQYLQVLITCVGLFSILIGSLGGFTQSKFKRLLAYSSINHMGFVLISLGGLTSLGFQSACFYMAVYVLTNTFIFVVLALNNYNLVGTLNFNYMYITDFKNFARLDKFMAVVFTTYLFSLGGIPPFPGFFAKFAAIFVFLLKYGLGLWFIIVYCSIVSTAYYIRIVKIMYYDLGIWRSEKLYVFLNYIKYNHKKTTTLKYQKMVYNFNPYVDFTLLEFDYYVTRFLYFMLYATLFFFYAFIFFLPYIITFFYILDCTTFY